MIPIEILDETAPLEAVVLGTAESLGGTPSIEKAYDPKSKQHILNGTYPKEEDLIQEMEQVAEILKRHNVEVYRPQNIPNYNQVFSRDIAIVIGDKLIIPCVTQERKKESDGIQHIEKNVEHVLLPDCENRMEGGDIIVWKGHLFIGYSNDEDFKKYTVARTNKKGVEYLAHHFPEWKIHAFELVKSDDDPYKNALHLDCCFQPVGRDKAVIYPAGFKDVKDVESIRNFFGPENIFEITQEEMYEMNSNFFSISPEVVISDRSFIRLNDQFKKWNLLVEEVDYRETAKMEGLLRCTTMPLRRKYE